MAELKPCPFCGSKEINVYKGKWAWKIECTNFDCGATISKTLKKTAIEAWNRRHEEPKEIEFDYEAED